MNDPGFLAAAGQFSAGSRSRGQPVELSANIFRFCHSVFQAVSESGPLANFSTEQFGDRLQANYTLSAHERLHPEIPRFTTERQAAMAPRTALIKALGEDLDALDAQPIAPDASGVAIDRERFKQSKIQGRRDRAKETDTNEKIDQAKALQAVELLLNEAFRATNPQVNELISKKDTPAIMALLRELYSLTDNSQLRVAGQLLDRALIECQPTNQTAVQFLPRLKLLLDFLKEAIPGRPEVTDAHLQDALRASLNPGAAYAAVVLEGRSDTTPPDTAHKLAVNLDREVAAEQRLAEARAMRDAKEKVLVKAHLADMEPAEAKTAAKTDAKEKIAAAKAAAKAKAAKNAAAKALAPAAAPGAATAAMRQIPVCSHCAAEGKPSLGHLVAVCWEKFPALKEDMLKNKTCALCKESGHIRRDCPEKVIAVRTQRCFAFATHSNRTILDSGCSHTALPSNRQNRRRLRNLRPAQGTVHGLTGGVPIVAVGDLPLTRAIAVPAVLVEYPAGDATDADTTSGDPGPSLVSLVQVLNASDSIGLIALPAANGSHEMLAYDLSTDEHCALLRALNVCAPVLRAREHEGVLVIDALREEPLLSTVTAALARIRGPARSRSSQHWDSVRRFVAQMPKAGPKARVRFFAPKPKLYGRDNSCSQEEGPATRYHNVNARTVSSGARYRDVAHHIVTAALLQLSIVELATLVFPAAERNGVCCMSATACVCTRDVTAMHAKSEPLTESELADYLYWHDVAGHPHDAMLLAQAKGGMIPGIPRRLRVPAARLAHKCTVCELAKGIANKLMKQAPEYVHPTRRGQIIALDTQFVLTALGLPHLSRYWLAAADVFTGYGWCVPVQNKAQIAAEAVSLLRRIDRLVKTEGGVAGVVHDMGTEIDNQRFHAFLDDTGIAGSHFAPGVPSGVVERPHGEAGNVLRTTKASCVPAVDDAHWTWWCKHQEMLRNYRPAHSDPRISRFEAMLGFKPTAVPHRFGAPCAVKIMGLKRPLLQMRALFGRWWGMLSNSQTVHMVCLKVTNEQTGKTREVVRRSRHIRFLPDAVLSEDDQSEPILEAELGDADLVDTENRTLYVGPWVESCSQCTKPGTLWCCDFCQCAYHETCSGSNRAQLESTWRCPACRQDDAALPFFPPECATCETRDSSTGVELNPTPSVSPGTRELHGSVELGSSSNTAPTNHLEPALLRSETQRLDRATRAANRGTISAMHSWLEDRREAQLEDLAHANAERQEGAQARASARRALRAQTLPPGPLPYDEGFMTAEEEHRLIRVSACASEARVRQTKLLRAKHYMLERKLAAKHLTRSSSNFEHRHLAALASAVTNLKAFEPPTVEGMYLDEKKDRETAATLRAQRLRARQDEEGRDEEVHDTSVPSWIQALGTNYVPLGGFKESDIRWINAFSAAGVVLPLAETIMTPRGYKQALLSPEWPMWQAAIEAELDQLRRRKAFTFVPRGNALGQCFLGTTWVFTVKNATDEKGVHYLKYKARLTVRGDQQRKQDIDPTQRSSPTVDTESIRIILATLAADPSAEFVQFDVVGAYLQATLDTNSAPIYLRVPDGMKGVPDGQVLLLRINLYGLVQAAYLWYQEISKTMTQQGWKRSYFDGCVWSRESSTGPTYMCLHVDDGIICGRDTKRHYDNLAAVYDLKFLGRPALFLGLQFEFFSNSMIMLHQSAYAQHLLRYWQNHPDHPMDTRGPHSHRDIPLDPGVVNELRNFENAPTRDERWYRELLGQLNWLLQTRPDLSIAIMHLARGIGHHTRMHEQAAHDLLKHIAATVDFGILYGRSPQSSATATAYERTEAVTYEDAEFGGDALSGYADQGVLVFLKGSLISFKSSRQNSKTKSTYEAEILSFSAAAHTSMRIRNYQTSFGLSPTGPAPIFVDNDPVIQYTNQVGLPRPSRNIVQSDHYGRDQRLEGHITVHPIASADNPADFMTKALPFTAHLRHRSTCGIFSRQTLLTLLTTHQRAA